MNSKLIIFWDMDGVLADWQKAACKTMNADYDKVIANWNNEWDLASQLGVSKGYMWSKIDAIHDWWEHIEPYPWLDELLKIAKKNESYILSAPHITRSCAAGKIAWISKHTKFGGRVILTKHKYLCAGPDRILIDDNDKKCAEFEKAGGNVILFPQVWNANREYAGDPIAYVKEKLNEFQN